MIEDIRKAFPDGFPTHVEDEWIQRVTAVLVEDISVGYIFVNLG